MGPCWFLVCITENKGNEYWSINNDFDFSFFVSKSGWPTVKQAQFKVYRSNAEVYRNAKIPHLSKLVTKGNIVQGKNLEKFLTTSEDNGSKIKVSD